MKLPTTRLLTKKLLLISFALITLLGNNIAHADFRKALDAYIARDGETMLKEVRDAVDRKNDDGLILFLNVMRLDEVTSKKQSIIQNSSLNNSQRKTTLESILNSKQMSDLNKYIETLIFSRNITARYIYHFKRESKFTSVKKDQGDLIRELEYLADKGSVDASIELIQLYSITSIKNPKLARKWLIKSAELGDPYSSISLAFSYLGYSPIYFLSPTRCEFYKINGKCFEKDIRKGNFWLKEAVKNVDRSPLYLRRFALEMGSMLAESEKNYRQAYLWYMLALNSPDFSNFGVSEMKILNHIKSLHEKNKLVEVAPDLARVWDDPNLRKEILYPRKLDSLPDLLSEVRSETKTGDAPIFSYLRIVDNLPFQLDVYKNGDVKIALFMQEENSMYMRVLPSRVEQFLAELGHLLLKVRYLTTSSRVENSYWCNVCKGNDHMFIVSDSKEKNIYYVGYDSNDKVDPEIQREITEITNLVEKYFPTVKLNCGIGNSTEYNSKCLNLHSNLTFDSK